MANAHTFKKRTDFPPACNASLFGVLAERRLQEKQGDAAGEEEEDVGDEEHASSVFVAQVREPPHIS